MYICVYIHIYVYISLYKCCKNFSNFVGVKWINHSISTNLQLNQVLMSQFAHLAAGYQGAYCCTITQYFLTVLFCLLSMKWYLTVD